ncbi:uncharacterized protein FOBCDRAFT_190395 [Fusarium oxysporum Fo47]|uniref:ABM domain-containing protein n=1 Tax=Fusarium oxysporum Fo47 TaxID=660027 RepID=W9JLR2_FUSOX|nr:uncharacterized protein FOBCDRAFT_190395 [Fusarium oxysporum Fo47]EWZ32992.1 hypothetical protein FOZG_14490 [Fusarium oxysporum Fo47]RKK95900.1 hypothetical protein BFJ71_g8077 [Fusarium oxysporum]WJG36902.1 hypothetical protein FOBCDRAFT_190395 [Fusarium oxysporum Fo47]
MANARSSQFAPYESTEIISLQFSNSTDPALLSDENTEVGKIWAATLKTYLDHPETGIVWWGIVHDAPNKAKLFIDWKSLAGRSQFEASQQATELASAWKSITVAPATRDTYTFTSSDVARQTALSSTYDTVTALLNFRFANALTSSEFQQLDAVLQELDRTIMLSPGAVVASYSIGGWSSDRRSYCAAYRYLNADALRNFIQGDNRVRELLQVLQSRASGGMELEFLETRVYKQGWQGSVTKTEPDNQTLSGFMAETQALFQSFDSVGIRGI